MNDRLPSHLEAAALVRRTEADGDFAMILRKGDADRGAILLFVSSRGSHVACLERALNASGNYHWQRIGPEPLASPEKLSEWTAKRVNFDENIWLIELDIADAERFIAETTASG